MAELQEMKAIFEDCLPVGDNVEGVNQYFNYLQEIIDTNDYQSKPDPIGREKFEHDDPDVEYAYISDALFKERSSRRPLRAIEQDVEDQPHSDEGQTPQLGYEESKHLTPIPECPQDCDLEHGDKDGDVSSR